MAETEKHVLISAELPYICGVTFVALFFPHFLVNTAILFQGEGERIFSCFREIDTACRDMNVPSVPLPTLITSSR